MRRRSVRSSSALAPRRRARVTMSYGTPRIQWLADDQITARTIQNQRLEKERKSISSNTLLYQSTRRSPFVVSPSLAWLHPIAQYPLTSRHRSSDRCCFWNFADRPAFHLHNVFEHPKKGAKKCRLNMIIRKASQKQTFIRRADRIGN